MPPLRSRAGGAPLPLPLRPAERDHGDRPEGAGRTLRGVRSRDDDEAPPRQHPQVAARRAEALSPGELAAREGLRPLDYGEAPQIGIGGDTGAGKTTLELYLIELYLRLCPGLVVVIDDKDPHRTPFRGQLRRDISHLRAEPLDPAGPRVLVIRGDVLNGRRADREAVAGYCKDVAIRGRAVAMFNDEAFPRTVAVNRQWRKGVEWLPLGFTHGRKMGGGWMNVWGAQIATKAPDEPFDESGTIYQFKTAGDPLDLLEEKEYLRGDRRLKDVIRNLHAMDSAPHLRGDFVMLRRGRDWDGHVYKLSRRSR